MCKTCTNCGITYENTTEYFHKHKLNKLHNDCKSCRNIYLKSFRKESRNKHKQKYLIYNKEWKIQNKNKDKEYMKKNKDKIRSELSDVYIKDLIKKSTRFCVKNPTPEYIEAYRQVVILKREQKKLINLTKSLKNGNSINL